ATSWEEFGEAWLNVRSPIGVTWNGIVQKAATSPSAKSEDDHVRLINLCAGLQEHHGPGRSWPLSCRKAAEVIGVPYQKAARLLKLLQFEKVIELVKTAGPKGSGRAAEYRVIVRRRK